MTDLTLLHTAEVHVATFDALASGAALSHLVRPDWLARAQNNPSGLDAELRAEITAAITSAQHTTGQPVLCTCTTLGEIAEAAGAIRLDWPMMQMAAQMGGPVLLTYCLDSTAIPSTSLLQRAMTDAGNPHPILSLPLPHLWPLFEQGDSVAFATAIAQAITDFLATSPTPADHPTAVVLAQASMAGAADLVDTDTPVLASPAIAMQQLLTKR